MRGEYLILCIKGLVLPYSQFIPWALAPSLDARLFVLELFANRISGFFRYGCYRIGLRSNSLRCR
jgi:hypothetical protein